jgi:ketosteroid isomerase-like protein
VRHGYRRFSEGDPSFLARLAARDIHFSFPGTSSWAADTHTKAELERWTQRAAAAGLSFAIDEVVVAGWPWRTTLCVRGRSEVIGADGTRVYSNRFVTWGQSAWGMLREYEVYEDTQRTVTLDRHLDRAVA